MPKIARSTILLSLILMASAAIAAAGIIQDLTVSLTLDQCGSQGVCELQVFTTGDPPWPAAGWANFTSIAPWTFNFVTGYPLSWYEGYNSFVYGATFGYGGNFSMTGPLGLTFSGAVTSGWDGLDCCGATVSVAFFGQWSNGLYGFGHADVETSFGDLASHLDTFVAPEPSSPGLMACGVLAIWGVRKRSWRRMNGS